MIEFSTLGWVFGAPPFRLLLCWMQSKGNYIADVCQADWSQIHWFTRRCGPAKAAPQLLAAAGLLDRQQVFFKHKIVNVIVAGIILGQVAGKVGGNRGNSLDLGWPSVENRFVFSLPITMVLKPVTSCIDCTNELQHRRISERSASAPSPYLSRRGSQSAYIDKEQVDFSCDTNVIIRHYTKDIAAVWVMDSNMKIWIFRHASVSNTYPCQSVRLWYCMYMFIKDWTLENAYERLNAWKCLWRLKCSKMYMKAWM